MSYGRFLQALHPDDREAIDHAVQDALTNHLEYQVEMRTVWPDGSLHWVAARGHCYYDAQNKPVRMSGAALDFTEHKRAAQHVRERQSESERFIRQYVANQTIAAIAHELNQPLNAIASYSAGALRLLENSDPPKEKLRQALEQNNRQALRAGQVIRELLAFLRNEEAITETLDLNVLVWETINTMKSDSLFNDVKTALELEENLPMVQANRVQVEKVLVNLLRNGVEAIHDAGLPMKKVWLTVSTHACGKFAKVTVKDNGPGLDETAVKRAFEPFFTTKPRGLGMGLAVSRALIEAHGGELWIEQASDVGANFHFTLPFA
jgi:C4-dicarboxylate-specific signal transduction histidine kinase